MKLWTMLIATAAVATPLPGQTAASGTVNTAPISAPAAKPDRRTAMAREFAVLYVPEDLVRAGAAREFQKNFIASFDSIPQNVELEKRYPGSRDVGLKAGLKSMGQFFDQNLAMLHGSVAEAAAKQLSESDLTQVNGFYRSPTGQRTLRAIAGNIDTTALAARARTDPDGPAMKPGDLEKMIDPGFIAEMSATDRAEAFKFMASPVGRRFAAGQPVIQAALLKSQNAAIEAYMPQVQAAIGEAIVAHIKTKRDAK